MPGGPNRSRMRIAIEDVLDVRECAGARIMMIGIEAARGGAYNGVLPIATRNTTSLKQPQPKEVVSE